MPNSPLLGGRLSALGRHRLVGRTELPAFSEGLIANSFHFGHSVRKSPSLTVAECWLSTRVSTAALTVPFTGRG